MCGPACGVWSFLTGLSGVVLQEDSEGDDFEPADGEEEEEVGIDEEDDEEEDGKNTGCFTRVATHWEVRGGGS